MAQQGFDTPAAAEAAFYSAFERADVEAMMDVWAPGEEVECIHPHGTRLRGSKAVRSSWETILGGPGGTRFTLDERHVIESDGLVLHTLTETLVVRGEPAARVLATNVYRRSAQGWHMVLHHASPPTRPRTRAKGARAPHALH